LNHRVFRDVDDIIEIDEFKMMDLPVNGSGDGSENDINHEPLSLRSET